MRTRALALLLGLVTAMLSTGASRAAGPVNGSVIYFDGMANPTTAVGTPFGFTGFFFAPTEFSPDGGSVASASSAGRLTVTDNTGSVTRTVNLPLPPAGAGALTWSPDGSQVAVLARKSNGTGRVLLVDVASGGVTTLLDSVSDGATPGLIVELSGISWHPGGGKIAFVGEVAGEFGSPFNAFRQLMTVDVASGQTAFYSSHPDLDCDTCTYASFSSPDWSPDGTEIVAKEEMTAGDGTQRVTVTRISVGQVSGTPVTANAKFNNRPIWSPDGSRILLTRVVAGDLVASAVPLGGGDPVDLPSDYLDWQPCPTGTCVSWTGSRTPTGLTAIVTTKGYCLPTKCVATSIQVRGAISPVVAVPLKVKLLTRKAGRWVTVTTKSTSTNDGGGYSTQFASPGGTGCRVRVAFAGNSTLAPSSILKQFSC